MCALSTTHLINIFTLKDTINVFSNPCAGTYIYLVCSQSWLRTQWWVLSSKFHLSSRKHTRWNDNKNFESSKFLQFADHVWFFKHPLCTSNTDDATLSVCPLCCL